MKKLGLFVMALLSTVASFAVDPHGARVDSEGGAGAGLFVLAVLVGLDSFCMLILQILTLRIISNQLKRIYMISG